MLQNAELDYVCFTSASAVRGFAISLEGLAGVDFRRVNAVCIGKVTAAEAEKHGMTAKIAKNATMDDMIDLMTALSRQSFDKREMEI
jgi:uroporphyrinogen III methyltransferase/synthase